MGNPVPLVPAGEPSVTVEVSDFHDFLENVQFVFEALLFDTSNEVSINGVVLTPEEESQVKKWKQISGLLEDLMFSKKRYDHGMVAMRFKRCEYVEVAEGDKVVYKK